MHRTTVRARLVIALLMICGSFSVALVADSATAAPRYKVKLSISDQTPLVGQRIGLSGRVKPAAPGARVKVQARAGGTGWVTISRPHLSKKSTYHASVTFPRAGSVDVRVVKPGSRNAESGASPAHHLRVSTPVGGPQISTSSLPNAVLSRAYSATIQIADHRGGTFAIAGDLPAGLTLNASTGVISGTPAKVEKKEFTVGFRDAAGRVVTKALSITVDETYLITSIKLPSWTVSHSHSTTLKAKIPGTWSIPVHLLPRGFAFDPATAVISGTGFESGTTTFPVTFTGTNGLTETRNLSITVLPDGAPEISTASVPGATVGIPYSATLGTVGNRNGTWTVVGGSLPAGLSLSGGGTISGTPTMPNWTPNGAPSFTVRFTQTGPHVPGNDSQVLTIQVDPNSAPSIGIATLPQGKVGQGYAATLSTVSSRQGTWEITSGGLPAGLKLDADTGAISGAPTTAGSSTFTVKFTALNGQSDSETFTIKVNA